MGILRVFSYKWYYGTRGISFNGIMRKYLKTHFYPYLDNAEFT